MDQESISWETVQLIKAVVFATNAAPPNITTKTVRNKNINLLTVSIVVKKDTLPENAPAIKRGFTERVDPVLDVGLFDTH